MRTDRALATTRCQYRGGYLLPLEADPLEGTWDQSGSDIIPSPRKEHGTSQEVTS